MQLPKTRRRQKLREKRCQYPGCGKIFFGIHISKYCHEHRKDRYRIRKRATPEDVNLKNQTIKHQYTEVVTMIMDCDLEGCGHEFEVKIYPRQYVYPKYCPEHRNEYRRVRHLMSIGRDDLIEEMKLAGDTESVENLMGSMEGQADGDEPDRDEEGPDEAAEKEFEEEFESSDEEQKSKGNHLVAFNF